MNRNKLKLLINVSMKFIIGFVLIAFLVFYTAGTLNFINGWLFIFSLMLPMLIFGIGLFKNDPETLQRRLDTKEREKSQILVIIICSFVFIASFALAGYSYRYNILRLPLVVSLIFVVIFLVGYYLYTLTIKQNRYASRTITVVDKQPVISDGLYGIVRHPLYFASMLVFLSLPLILGSVLSLFPMLLYPALMIIRIKNEEAILLRDLPGYDEYLKKVKYRLIPYVW